MRALKYLWILKLMLLPFCGVAQFSDTLFVSWEGNNGRAYSIEQMAIHKDFVYGIGQHHYHVYDSIIEEYKYLFGAILHKCDTNLKHCDTNSIQSNFDAFFLFTDLLMWNNKLIGICVSQKSVSNDTTSSVKIFNSLFYFNSTTLESDSVFTLPDSLQDYAMDKALALDDGGLAIIMKNVSGSKKELMLLKMDSLRQVLWTLKIPGPEVRDSYKMCKTDGAILVSGRIIINNLVYPYALKASHNGDLLWYHAYSTIGNGAGQILASKDKYYLISPGAASQQKINADLNVSVLDTFGNYIEQFRIRPTDSRLDRIQVNSVFFSPDTNNINVSGWIFKDDGAFEFASFVSSFSLLYEEFNYFEKFGYKPTPYDKTYISFQNDMVVLESGDLILGGQYRGDGLFTTYMRRVNGKTGCPCMTLDPLSVAEILSKEQTSKVYPNPTTTHFILQSTQNINHIQVFDLRGALVLEQNVQSTEHQVQLSEAGTYIIHIHLQDGSTERQKVVKMKE